MHREVARDTARVPAQWKNQSCQNCWKKETHGELLSRRELLLRETTRARLGGGWNGKPLQPCSFFPERRRAAALDAFQRSTRLPHLLLRRYYQSHG
jgi:hypothetical protein